MEFHLLFQMMTLSCTSTQIQHQIKNPVLRNSFTQRTQWIGVNIILALSDPRGSTASAPTPTPGSRFSRFDTQVFRNIGTLGIGSPLKRLAPIYDSI